MNSGPSSMISLSSFRTTEPPPCLLIGRLAFGRKSLNNDPSAGCMPYWVSIDNGLFSRGAPIDLVYWEGDEFVYPSGGVRLARA